jgi:DnaK suppressor protein
VAKPVAKAPAVDKEHMAKVAERKRVDAGNFAVASIVPQKTLAEKIEAKKAHPMKIERSDIKANLLGPVDWIPAYKAKAGEEYMNDTQLDHFRHVLTEWKKELTRSADITVGHMKEDVENYSDMADRATQEEEFSLELRTRDREYKLLKKIDEALMKIKDGSFGYCDSCGVEIGLPRLEVRPTATLCIDCKTVEEIRERQLTF